MSLSNERGQSCASYFNAQTTPALARETKVALDEKYLPRYRKAKKPFKLYDGIGGSVMFPHLKAQGTNLANRVRKECKKAIKDKKLTKGFYDPAYLFKTLEGFYTEDRKDPINNPAFKRAKERLMKDVVPEVPLVPAEVKWGMNIRQNLTTLNTSAGFKFYGKKKKAVQSYMIRRALEMKEDVKSGKSFYKIPTEPFIAITRSQLPATSTELKYVRPMKDGKVDYKGRLVWCMDAAMVLFESQYARPCINYMSQNWTNIAMGKKPEEIRSICCEMSEDFLYWYSSDYSKYDSTVPACLIRHAFDIIKACFDERYHREIDFISMKFINGDILMPDGNIYSVKKGIKSGSYFTQIIGSLVNALMLLTFMEQRFTEFEKRKAKQESRMEYDMEASFGLHSRPGIYAYMVMGDDNVFALRFKLNYHAFASYVNRMFGMNINVQKSDVGEKGQPINFLKRLWTRDGEFRDEVDLVINFLHPERRRTYKNYSPYHVLFGYFITYRGSMERLGFSLKGLLKGMNESGFGIECFKHMPREELPGSIASLKYSNVEAFNELIDYYVEEAERDYYEIWQDRAI